MDERSNQAAGPAHGAALDVRKALVCVALAAVACLAAAGTITVDTFEDELDFIPNDRCSLREAVVTINEQRSAGVGGCSVSGTLGTDDTIVLSTGTYALTRTGNHYIADQDKDDLDLHRDVRIEGAGARATVVDGEAVGGHSYEGGVITVASGVSATLTDLAVVRGYGWHAGGISNQGTLVLERVAVSDNISDWGAGGVHSGEGSDLTVRHSAVTGNESIDGLGGGLDNFQGDVLVENVTISGNRAAVGGGIHNYGGLMILSSVTVTANTGHTPVARRSGIGGGIFNANDADDVRIESSLIAGNLDESSYGEHDCSGAFDSRGYNLVGDGTGCDGFGGTSDKIGSSTSPIDPLIGALANNGGATSTHALLAGSPAIDGGALGIVDACLAVDQRDQPRPNDGDGNGFTHCDIGAFEAPEATEPPQANLEVELADAPDPVGAGDDLTYHIGIRNNGPTEATIVNYQVTLPEGVAMPPMDAETCAVLSGDTFGCTIGDLAAGQTADVQVTVQAPSSPTTIITEVSVNSVTPDPYLADNSAQEATIVAASATADLALDMTGPTTSLVGAELLYTLTASNAGPADGTDVVITDFLPADTTFVSASPGCSRINTMVQCALGTLGAGETRAVELRITAPDSPGSVTNSASVNGSSTDERIADNNDSVATWVALPPEADLFIAKNGPSVADAGSVITYTLIPFNNGPDAAGGVVVTDVLPPGTELVDAPPYCTHAAGTVTCELGDMEPFGTVTSFDVSVRTPFAAGPITNTATIAGEDEDPYPDNDASSITTDVTATAADLAIAKTAPLQVQTGTELAYGIVVENLGPGTAAGVVVTDALPPDVSFVSASTECAHASGTVTCDLGTLDPESNPSASLTIRVVAPADPVTVTNTASVTSDTTDPEASNDSDSAETSVVAEETPPGADLRLVKSAPREVSVGAPVQYTLSVFNAGPDAADDVVVEDELPAEVGFAGASAGCSLAGSVVTCALGSVDAFATREVVIDTVAPDAPATLVNAASVRSATTDANDADNSDEAETTVLAQADAGADVGVSKSGPAEAPPATEITYGLTVYNLGPESAEGVTITDVLPEGTAFVEASSSCGHASGAVTCSIGVLAVGEAATASITLTTPAAEGILTNTATVSSSTDDPNDTNDSHAVETRVAQDAEPPVDDPGDDPLELAFALGGGTPGDADATAGSTDVPVLQVDAINAGTANVRITSVTLGLAASVDDGPPVTRARIHLDANGNGMLDEGDEALGSGDFAADASQTLLALDAPVQAATTAQLLVTVDIGSDRSSAPRPSLAYLGFAAAGALLAIRRRRHARAMLLSALVLVALGGCAGAPPPAGSAEYRVSLVSAEAETQTTGTPVDVSGLPLDGAAIRVPR